MLLALLCGCRVRTTAILPSGDPAFPRAAKSGPDEGADGTDLSAGDSGGTAESLDSGEGSADEVQEGQTVEDPDALRKEYDENASAEVISGAHREIHGEGEGDGAYGEAAESAAAVSKLNDRAGQSVTRKVRADEAENTGVSEDAEQAESSLQYYSVLLKERTDSLYECKRSYVYWETARDHVTIFKTSSEHQMILNAGAYDVSARLTEERLQIDDGWVVRKNPGVIVKVVPASVLGGEVRSEEAAESLALELASREGWNGIDAVRQGRVLLLSEELFTEPYLRLGAELALAKTAAPDIFTDVDPASALIQLIIEAAGESPEGVFLYKVGGW